MAWLLANSGGVRRCATAAVAPAVAAAAVCASVAWLTVRGPALTVESFPWILVVYQTGLKTKKDGLLLAGSG